MSLHNKRKSKKTIFGYTLIELLIVLGILSILFLIVLLAINPKEQLNQTNDVSTNAVSKDVSSAIKEYFISQLTYPWVANPLCKSELSFGKTLLDVPDCVSELTQDGKLQTSFMNGIEPKNVYITECSDAIALCYHPQSQKYSTSTDTKFTQNGVIQPGCPSTNSSNDCFSCTFTTNNGQGCFQAMNPNGSLALVPSPTPNQPLPVPTRASQPTCSNKSGQIACMAKVVSDSQGNPLSSLAPPGGYGPVQVHTAYNLPCTPGGPVQSQCLQPVSFGPQTIAIVDAFGDPTIESDLDYYSYTYSLPICNIANGCLTILNQNGTSTPIPAADPGWALETSLDVEMAHAVCQTCKILLVEANSNSFSDIAAAENEAASQSPTAISNSYGAWEFSGETSFDPYYNHPGIYVTVSSGDSGYGTSYPAASKNVISVGGTSLYLNNDNTYASESVWSGTGSGCSGYETAYSFQTLLSNWSQTGCGSYRSIADVSADADPNTGVAVYDTTSFYGQSGWWILGGTSVSSPLVSAAFALTGNPPAGQQAGSYIYANAEKFRDIVFGIDGNCTTIECQAGAGYDGPTGLGSPDFISGGLTTPTPTIPGIPTPTVTPTPTPTPVTGPYPIGTAWVVAGYTSNPDILLLNSSGSVIGKIQTGTSINPLGIAQVGSQMWVPSFNSIARFNLDGTTTSKITGLNTGDGSLAVVGTQVWSLDGGRNDIYRFNFNGTSAGSNISGNGLSVPSAIAQVGTQVWVINATNPTEISRFNLDGTSAGTVITAPFSGVGGIAVVGAQVWVEGGKSIYRFNFDGSIAANPITGNGLSYPNGIAVVGSHVWVTNTFANTIAVLNFDGSSAGNLIADNNIYAPQFIVQEH